MFIIIVLSVLPLREVSELTVCHYHTNGPQISEFPNLFLSENGKVGRKVILTYAHILFE